MPFTIERNDLACMDVDVVVVTANEGLQINGGCGLAVARVAGLGQMQAACDALGGCPTGSAVVTPGFALPARHVVHVVGPVWQGGTQGEQALLRRAYDSALLRVAELGARSVALPLVSAHTFGFPVRLSFTIAVDAVKEFLFSNDCEVHLVLYDDDAMAVGVSLYGDVAEYIDAHYVESREELFHNAPYAADARYLDEPALQAPPLPSSGFGAALASERAGRGVPRAAEPAPLAPAKKRPSGIAALVSHVADAVDEVREHIFERLEPVERRDSNVQGAEAVQAGWTMRADEDTWADAGIRADADVQADAVAPGQHGAADQVAQGAGVAQAEWADWEEEHGQADWDECFGAGTALREGEDAAVTASFPPLDQHIQVPSASMGFCPVCGASVSDETYCMQCGVRLRDKCEELKPLQPMPNFSTPSPQAGLTAWLDRLDAPFSTTLLALIDGRGMTDAEVYKRANMSRQLFSKIRSDASYRPTKKTVLALCVAMGLDLRETEDLLRRAGFALSRSSKSDVIVEYFIVNGNHDIFAINEALYAFDQPLL